MNENGHRQALEELRASRGKLDPVDDIRAYAEMTHGMAIHAVAAGFLRRLDRDYDQHQGMARRLRTSGFPDIGDTFQAIERIRAGRWYGGQHNGDTARELDDLLAEIEAWSLGQGSP